jgi:hydrogenase 3 maturation protease
VRTSLDLSPEIGKHGRIAIIGVGSDLRGDDAAGVEVIRGLRRRVRSSRVLLIEAGVAPENFTSRIKRFRPTLIIVVDAADFGGEPGETISVEAEAVGGIPISTHTMPISLLAEYLGEETGARVIFLGVQPKEVGLGSRMSEEVQGSIKGIVDALAKMLRSHSRSSALGRGARVIPKRPLTCRRRQARTPSSS